MKNFPGGHAKEIATAEKPSWNLRQFDEASVKHSYWVGDREDWVKIKLKSR